MKSGQLWLRGFISIILNALLRVFAISAFLKVIHAPKTPKRGFFQVPRKLTSSIAFFKSLQSGLPMNLKNTPMPRISYPQKENPEKKKLKKKSQKFFLNFFFSGFLSFRQLTLGMRVFIRFMGSPDCKDLKNTMEEVNFRCT